jgi:membrane protease YdiL (CAAX protease family)
MNDVASKTPKFPKKSTTIQRIIQFPLTRIVVGSIVCMLVSGVINALLLKPILGLLDLEEYISRTIRFATNAVIILVTYYWLFKYYEKREITELSLKHALKESLSGILAGMLMISCTILALLTTGNYQVLSTNEKIALLIYPLTYQIFIGVTEEVLFRGIIYRITENYLGTRIALIISAVLFAVLHLTNEGANIVTMLFVVAWGVMLAITFSLTRRLWFPIFFHAGWNFAMIFYGTLVSGMDEFLPYSLFQGELHGHELLTGGAFGPENSIITIILTLIVVIALYIGITKKGRLIEPYWREKAQVE